jgi:hypothetical protein
VWCCAFTLLYACMLWCLYRGKTSPYHFHNMNCFNNCGGRTLVLVVVCVIVLHMWSLFGVLWLSMFRAPMCPASGVQCGDCCIDVWHWCCHLGLSGAGLLAVCTARSAHSWQPSSARPQAVVPVLDINAVVTVLCSL